MQVFYLHSFFNVYSHLIIICKYIRNVSLIKRHQGFHQLLLSVHSAVQWKNQLWGFDKAKYHLNFQLFYFRHSENFSGVPRSKDHTVSIDILILKCILKFLINLNGPPGHWNIPLVYQFLIQIWSYAWELAFLSSSFPFTPKSIY